MKTPAEFEKRMRDKKIARRVKVCMAAMIGLCFGSWGGMALSRSRQAAPTEKDGNGTIRFVSSGVTYSQLDEQPTKYQPVPDGDALVAFHAAVKSWTEALGGELPIKYPRLVQGDNYGSCNGIAIAWAQMELNRVVLCRLYDNDPKTIFLHEVGHLLGVPHIQGDKLMDATTHGEVLKNPTPFAVAVAKAFQDQKNLR